MRVIPGTPQQLIPSKGSKPSPGGDAAGLSQGAMLYSLRPSLFIQGRAGDLRHLVQNVYVYCSQLPLHPGQSRGLAPPALRPSVAFSARRSPRSALSTLTAFLGFSLDKLGFSLDKIVFRRKSEFGRGLPRGFIRWGDLGF